MYQRNVKNTAWAQNNFLLRASAGTWQLALKPPVMLNLIFLPHTITVRPTSTGYHMFRPLIFLGGLRCGSDGEAEKAVRAWRRFKTGNVLR